MPQAIQRAESMVTVMVDLLTFVDFIVIHRAAFSKNFFMCETFSVFGTS